MIIGVFLKNISPDAGGGFTFQETVLQPFINTNSKQQIIIFHYGCRVASDTDLIKYVSLGKNKLSVIFKKIFYSIISRNLQYAFYRLSRFLKINLPYPCSSILDAATRKTKTDIMWFPTPEVESVECPYICTVWDLEHRIQPYFPEVSLLGQWNERERHYKKLLPRASYVVTGTEVGKKEISHFYGVSPDRIRILPHPTPSFALGARANLDKPEFSTKNPYVLYPAQFWAHKNHATLLQAIKELKDIDAVFVGSDKGNKKYILDLAKKLEISDRVHFLGFISRKELIALYKYATAMVYPSLCGPENLPPLEAFALGCPVIASRIPGSIEQLGDAAVLVNGLDKNEIAKAILKIKTETDFKQQLVHKGYLRAQKYTDREFAKDMGEIFNEFEKIHACWRASL